MDDKSLDHTFLKTGRSDAQKTHNLGELLHIDSLWLIYVNGVVNLDALIDNYTGVEINDVSVRKIYEGSKCTFIVSSHFNGDNDLAELIYQMLVREGNK